MSIMRCLRWRLFHMNPVTTFLVVIFVASVMFLISAVRKNVGHQTPPAAAAEFGGSADDSMSMSADETDGRQHRSKQKSKTSEDDSRKRYMVVGDDEIQTCQMTLEWATGSRQAKETSAAEETVVGRSTDTKNEQRKRRRALCDDSDGSKSDGSLFYVNRGDSSIRVNRTWLQHHGDAELVSCDYRVVTRLSDAGDHDRHGLSESKSIGRLPLGDDDVLDVGRHEFVLITCQLTHRKKRLRMQSTVDVDGGRRRLAASDQTTATRGRGNSDNGEMPADDGKRPRRRRHTSQLVGDGNLLDPSLQLLGSTGARSDVDDRRQSSGARKSLKSSTQGNGNETRDAGRRDGFTNGDHDVANGETGAGEHNGNDQQHLPERTQSTQNHPEQPSQRNRVHHDLRKNVDDVIRSDKSKARADDDENAAGLTSYDQFVIRILPDEEVLKHQTSASRQRQAAADGDAAGLDVLVLALSGVSRADWQRHMPRSRKLLTHRLNGVTLTGFNALGDTTAGNVVPMLTGIPFGSLSSIRVNGNEVTFADTLPFVWNRFEQRRYATLYAEDAATGVFQANFHGFQHPPVHHYMRPFWQAVAASKQEQSRLVDNLKLPGHRLKSPLCQKSYDFVLRYVSDFFNAYPIDVPKFAFALINDLHRSLIDDDRGSDENLSTDFDVNFEQFLLGLTSSEEFRRRTVLFVLSDHGPSYGSTRAAHDGGELRQPLALVVLPESRGRQMSTHSQEQKAPGDVQQHPQPAPGSAGGRVRTRDWSKLGDSLVRNADRLTSPLDIHATLFSLLDLDRLLVQVDVFSQ